MDKTASLTQNDRLRTDFQMLVILLAHVPVVSLLVPIGYGTMVFAIIASGLVGALVLIGYAAMRGTRACSILFGICLMLFSAIMIQAQMGRIEMHFHIFSALALIIIYRDWVPVVAAAGTIAIHHLVLTALQLSDASFGQMPVMIFNYGCSWPIAFLHAAFVVFEASILVFFAIRMAKERRDALQIIELIQSFSVTKDLSGRINKDRSGAAGRSFNNMLDQFSDIISAVRELAGKLSTDADELTSASERTNRTINEQSQETDQAATATHEMSTSIHEVAQNAQMASDSAIHASEASAEARSSVDHSITLTEATNAAMQNSSRMVNELVAKVGSIDSVVASINDISDQTNLLALNAAIEAARAGEHGRGFAVVAEEVRNLSRRTQTLTGEIRTTIDALKHVSEETLTAIGIGQTRSTETTSAVRKTGEAISAIDKAIREVKDMNYQIASASEQQASVSSQINESIQLVTDRNSDVVTQAYNTKSMAERLRGMVAEIDGLVNAYRVN